MREFESAQALFDYVVSKLIAQGKPAVLLDGGCRYVCKDGRRCAAGWLLPDDMPPTEKLDESIPVPGTKFCLDPQLSWILQGELANSVGFMHLVFDLQRAHDKFSVFGDSLWLTRFKETACHIAKIHGLKATVLGV